MINIGSIDGIAVPGFENYSYSAAKAGLHHPTKHMASALAPSIFVNAIAPGPFPTRMMEVPLAEHGDEIREKNPSTASVPRPMRRRWRSSCPHVAPRSSPAPPSRSTAGMTTTVKA